MSSTSKRQANEAFGDNDTPPNDAQKRRRKSKNKREDVASTANTKKVRSTSGGAADTTKGTAVPQTAAEDQVASTVTEGVDDIGSVNTGQRPVKDKGNTIIEMSAQKDGAMDNQLVPTKAKNRTEKRHEKKPKDGLKRLGGKHGHKGRTSREEISNKSGWNSTILGGGLFLDQDPLLSEDDQHLILPTRSNIQIFSTKTSLPVRSLPIGETDPVTSCILSPNDQKKLLVSTYGGKISVWNWTTGKKLNQWKARHELIHIRAMPAGKAGEDIEEILLLHNTQDGQRQLSHCTLTSDLEIKETVILKRRGMLPSISVLKDGETIVVAAGDRLLFGTSSNSTSKLSPAERIWREVTVPGRVTSIDTRSRQEGTSAKKSRTAIDVVLGLQNGVILVYDDILFRLIGKEKAAKDVEIFSKRLHWHRDVVLCIKWSRDGNYLISGGHETVLVIWQLDTNQKQYLPHLSAPINKMTISTSGSSYAIKLGDNSVMVLSTLDLLPSTNINGLSITQTEKRIPMAINPKEPNQILLATSTDLTKAGSATMLQTFDVKTNIEVYRQALARNLTTVVNVSPKGYKIGDPDVTHCKVSHDGKWMATVDEWSPNSLDTDPLYPRCDGQAARDTKIEVCLRFWTLKEDTKLWELVTRVDAPHDPHSHSILQLAPNPVKTEFTTVGRDGILRIWSPTERIRDGVHVRNKVKTQLYTWQCSYAVQPDATNLEVVNLTDSAAFAYSEDGSTIVVSWSQLDASQRKLHFINSRTGELRLSLPNLLSNGRAEIAFSGVCLILLSDRLCLWDTVNLGTIFQVSLKDKFLRRNNFLAVNSMDHTFAIALNPINSHTPTQVVVFDSETPGKILCHLKVHGQVKALFPATRATGYISVDVEARIRHLKPLSTATSGTSILDIEATSQELKGLDDIFGARAITDSTNRDKALLPVTDASQANLDFDSGHHHDEDDDPTTAPLPKQSLESILAQNATAAGTTSGSWGAFDLFQKVAGLFARPGLTAR